MIFSKQILVITIKLWFLPYLGQNPVCNKCLNGCHVTLRIVNCDEYVLSSRYIIIILKSVLIDHRSRGCLHRNTEGASICEGCILKTKEGTKEQTLTMSTYYLTASQISNKSSTGMIYLEITCCSEDGYT